MRRMMIQCDRCQSEILADEEAYTLTVMKRKANKSDVVYEKRDVRIGTVDLCAACGRAFQKEVRRGA